MNIEYKKQNINNLVNSPNECSRLLNVRQLLIEGARIHSARDFEIASDWFKLKNTNNKKAIIRRKR